MQDKLLIILEYAKEQIENSNGEILEGITIDNIETIKKALEL